MRFAPLLAVSLAAMLLGGCGYTTRPSFRTDVRTVAVPIAENRSFYRGYERDLTEAIIKEMELRTPYKVTAAGHADTILHCTIVRVNQGVLSRTYEGDLPQQVELRVTLDVVWTEARTGKVLRERRGLEATGRYVPTLGVNDTVSAGQHEAMAAMADQVIAMMRDDW